MASLDGVAARIADDLDDREAWIVLADGLLDRDDERGRWINLAFGDEPRDLDECLALEARLHRGGDGGFQWPGARLSWRFGFVVRVQVPWDDHTLARLAALHDHRDGRLWRSLSLSGVPVNALQALHTAPFASRLRTLTLASNDLGDDGLRVLAEGTLPSLTKLDVQNNRATASGLADLLSAPFIDQLQTLRLRNNPLGPAGARVLSTMASPTLKTLDLTRTALTDAGVRALGSGPLAATVQGLGLAQNELTGSHLTPFTRMSSIDLSGNPHLTLASVAPAMGGWASLKVDHCALDDADASALVATPTLDQLSMARNPGVTTRGWLALAHIDMPNLRQLRLDRCAVRGFEGTPSNAFPRVASLHLAANPLARDTTLAEVTLPSLRALGVRGCGVGEGLETWTRAPWFARLEELDVSGQALDLQGLGTGQNLVQLQASQCGLAEPLDALWALPKLELLDLSRNRLAHAAVWAHARHPNLRHLNLTHNGLDDAAVAAMAEGPPRFPRLQHLFLRGNALSPAMSAALQGTLIGVLL